MLTHVGLQPDNTASGDVWNPPDTESTMGISYDGCEAEAVGPKMVLSPVARHAAVLALLLFAPA